MHYITSDIHNDSKRFSKLLKRIDFSDADHLYILGDLFDRTDYDPDPVDVYFTVLRLGEKCTVVRGNHDNHFAEYIIKYYGTSERKRKKLPPYPYNTFELLQQRLTPVDIQNLAKQIMTWPLQVRLEFGGTNYLLAHAMTSLPDIQEKSAYYLLGDNKYAEFLQKGIEGYVSICGHSSVGEGHIWKNALGNVYMCDCGCGFRSGKLGCLCLETKEEFYV